MLSSWNIRQMGHWEAVRNVAEETSFFLVCGETSKCRPRPSAFQVSSSYFLYGESAHLKATAYIGQQEHRAKFSVLELQKTPHALGPL
jgi:hypothetical protein